MVRRSCTPTCTLSDHLLGDLLTATLPAGYSQLGGLTREGWKRTGALADGADRPGAFTALRGFEWSEPTLGHVNVWFTAEWTDVLDLGQMKPLCRWLSRQTGLLGLGDGGAEGIAGFNHPGREPGRFDQFALDPSVRDQMVSLEMLNRRDDYLAQGYADGRPSPLCACLNAGWRTGITGCADEHGTDWGFPEAKAAPACGSRSTPARECSRRCGHAGSSPPARPGSGWTQPRRTTGVRLPCGWEAFCLCPRAR